MASTAQQSLTPEHQLALEAEIAALTEAARQQEKLVVEGYRQMDEMLRAVETQRNELRGANDTLARAQSHLDRIIDTMDEALVVIGNDGNIELVNARLLELTGYKREELHGAAPAKLFVHTELQELAGSQYLGDLSDSRTLLRLFSTRRDCQIDGHLVAKGGACLAHLFRWSNLYSAAGKKEGVVIVGTDVRKLRFALSALSRAHDEMRHVLDNVAQGLLTIGMDGVVGEERSARVEQWFGPMTSGAKLWEYLGTRDASFGDAFEAGWDEVVADIMPIELTIDQLPTRLVDGERLYDVHCKPTYENGEISGGFLVVTDVTERIRAARERAIKSEVLDVLDHLNRDRKGFLAFFAEAGTLVERIIATAHGGDDAEPAILMRLLHTLKGNSSLFGVKSIEGICHRLEDAMRERSSGLTQDEREELEVAWQGFVTRVEPLIGQDRHRVEVVRSDLSSLAEMVERGADQAQLALLIRRMELEPTELRLSRLAEQISALAQRLGKGDVQVQVQAAEPRFPETAAWNEFWSAFSHGIRNAVDHGIESPEERRDTGKPLTPTIKLESVSDGARITVVLADDGRGIDWGRVRAKAERLGLPHDTPEALRAALLSDGFSTQEQVSLVSGRGVGLGALVAAAEALGGEVDIESEVGAGTTFKFTFGIEQVV